MKDKKSSIPTKLLCKKCNLEVTPVNGALSSKLCPNCGRLIGGDLYIGNPKAHIG
jgi:predicted RNA-binding Zn-ribbon protein involved in translation (DUF1610 family)